MNYSRQVTTAVAVAMLFSSIASGAVALDPNTTDARMIMKAVSAAQTVSRASSRVRMLIRDSSGTRERVIAMRAKRYGDAYKTLVQIEQPPDLHDTGFLTIDYTERGRSDEQWIYVPKLHRVSRLADSGKSDSFVGSDFSISDLSIAGSVDDDYEFKLIAASVKVGDDDCWLIETKPRTSAVRSQTGYDRSQFWVSKSKLLVLQLKGWLADSKKTKYMKASDVRNAQGVWTPYRLQMRTLLGDSLVSETLLERLHVNNDATDVVDSDFTVQRLGRGT